MGGDERLHPDLHAGVGADRRRHELAAGRRDDPARQPDRAHPDAAQCARRGALRHSVSGIRARFLWSARRQRAGGAARAGGLRLVRNPDLDRRTGHLHRCCRFCGRRRRGPTGNVGLLLLLLGAQHVRGLARHRDDQGSRRRGCAVHADRRRAAAVVDDVDGRRIRAGPQRAEQISDHG